MIGERPGRGLATYARIEGLLGMVCRAGACFTGRGQAPPLLYTGSACLALLCVAELYTSDSPTHK